MAGKVLKQDMEDERIEFEAEWYRTAFFGWLLALLLPPVGFWLLWSHPSLSRVRRVAGTAGLVFHCGLYGLFVLWLGLQAGWWELEWRGGGRPSLVRRASGPNPILLEQDRAGLQNRPRPVLDRTAQPTPYWTDFRGPQRDGRYGEQPIMTQWPSRGLRQLWRQPCGGGYASFVVGEGLAFTIEQRVDDEVVVAYHLESGYEMWAYPYRASFSEWMGGDGPRATPTYHRGRIFSLGATGELVCLGASSGTVIWRRNVLADLGARNLRYGLAASPMVVGDHVVVQAGDGGSVGSLAAYDTLTGERVWSALPEAAGYASPLRITVAGTDQLVLVLATRVVGFDPAAREILWSVPWEVAQGNSICLPVPVGDGRLFLGAGYGTGSAVIELAAADGRWQAREVWRNRNLRTKFNPAVHDNGFLYGLDEGVLTCVDAATGERRWREGRYGYGQLLAANGHLLVLSATGQLVMVEATPEAHREVGRLSVLRGKTWNVPALAHGRLLVRNSSEMACYEIGMPQR